MATTETTTTPTRNWFDYDSGSEYLGISRRAMQRLVADHKIGYTKLGLRTLFSQEQLEQFIADSTVEPTK
ncbi:excisionase family DNA binding protein [Mycetocola sp. CAN_C7]|uniref:helix-turn-helix domain-containing protein n=1 Tax=Mycetocola sp. CAN_C7 TaxID=2787724 RepID=UPI0018C9B86F